MVITIPSEYQYFFGDIVEHEDGGVYTYISDYICDLSQKALIVMRCNAVQTNLKQFDSYDVLYSFSPDNVSNYNYYYEKIPDIVQVKQPYTKTRNIILQFYDQNGS